MNAQPILQVIFFHNPSGSEPVREWLKGMDKRIAQQSARTLSWCNSVGRWVCRSCASSKLSDGRIARVFFTVRRTEMVLLHGFIKKSQKTPSDEMALAQGRKNLWWQGVE